MRKIKLFIALILASAAVTTVKADPLRYSLGLFETGANTIHISRSDFMKGGSGEVSRYQIMPDVWKRYSKSKDFHNPDVAWEVAVKILNERLQRFRDRMDREPTPTELYLLWNKPGHFSAAKYSLTRVDSHYFNRAQRFGNLYRAVQISYEKRDGTQASVGKSARDSSKRG